MGDGVKVSVGVDVGSGGGKNLSNPLLSNPNIPETMATITALLKNICILLGFPESLTVFPWRCLICHSANPVIPTARNENAEMTWANNVTILPSFERVSPSEMLLIVGIGDGI